MDETRKKLRSENDVRRKLEQRAQTMLQYVNSGKEERNKKLVTDALRLRAITVHSMMGKLW